MAKFVCDACGWEYDEELGSPDNGIAPGTKFADLPDDFVCPLCGVGKDMFSEAWPNSNRPTSVGAPLRRPPCTNRSDCTRRATRRRPYSCIY